MRWPYAWHEHVCVESSIDKFRHLCQQLFETFPLLFFNQRFTADVSCVSNENILIGVTIALVILLVLTNIPNAVRIYNYLRAKFRKDTDPNNEGSSYSSEAEMKLLDDPEASSRHEPVPNDPVVVNDRMQPGPGAQPHHHSAPNIPPADIAQIPYQRPQPGGLPQPHSSGHDPDVPYSGSYSLPHEFNDDKEQTRVLTPYPPAQSGKDVRWQRQPSTSYGNYRSKYTVCQVRTQSLR